MFQLDALQYTLPFDVSAKSEDGTSSSSLVRVQFYLASRKRGADKVTVTYLNTITCKNLIKRASPETLARWKRNDDWQFWEAEILAGTKESEDWLCPDTTSLDIYSDPYLFSEGN